MRHELDVYAGALHRRQPCGKSLYHLLNDYEANAAYPELPPFDEDLMKHIDQEGIEKQEIMLERLIADDSWEKDIEVRKRVVGSLAGTFRDC